MGNIAEAKYGSVGRKIGQILGVPIVSTPKEELLRIIDQYLEKKLIGKPLFLVTAYSEFFLESQRNAGFKRALARADLIVPDGVIVPAALDFLKKRSHKPGLDLALGLQIGRQIIGGKYADQIIPGVKLADQLIRAATAKNKKVLLLGGWQGVAERLAARYRKELKTDEVMGYQGPMDVDKLTRVEKMELTETINNIRPDVLLVAFGRFKQEKWIAGNLEDLKVKVVVGVGSSFDELAGEGQWARSVPKWIEKRGLKWLWRVWGNPGHLKRAWNAFPILAWKIYRSQES